MAQIADRTTMLQAACTLGEDIYRRVGALQAAADSDDLQTRLAGMPLNARWVSEADSILLYRASKWGALFVGGATGEGFLISRLPSPHPSLFRWSAPCFVRFSLRCFGLTLGRQRVESFTTCMTPGLRRLLSGPAAARSLAGLDASLSFGGLQHQADIIALPNDDVGTVGVNQASGALVGLSVASGTLAVDAAKNAAVYGPGATPLQLLHGTVPAPREMQPLYGLLSAALSGVERVTPPARVSASLERFSTGRDPDRRMVMANGTVLREDVTVRAADQGKDKSA